MVKTNFFEKKKSLKLESINERGKTGKKTPNVNKFVSATLLRAKSSGFIYCVKRKLLVFFMYFVQNSSFTNKLIFFPCENKR